MRGRWSARYGREMAVAAAIVVLLGVLAVRAPGYFGAGNLVDLFLANTPLMLVALGMTLVLLTGQIDISVGSVFAIASVVTGVCAKAGMPSALAAVVACGVGAVLGAVNGGLVVGVGVPSIVVTLATMVILRDGLRYVTQGAWVGDLPAGFAWFGMGQAGYVALTAVLVVGLTALFAWGLRYLRAGRAVYATGASEMAARMVGIRTGRVVWTVFVVTGALAGLAGGWNAVRFEQIPGNAGLGMELEVIAAVAVGGNGGDGRGGNDWGNGAGGGAAGIDSDGADVSGGERDVGAGDPGGDYFGRGIADGGGATETGGACAGGVSGGGGGSGMARGGCWRRSGLSWWCLRWLRRAF